MFSILTNKYLQHNERLLHKEEAPTPLHKHKKARLDVYSLQNFGEAFCLDVTKAVWP